MAAIWCTLNECRHTRAQLDPFYPNRSNTDLDSSQSVVVACQSVNGRWTHGISVVAYTASQNQHRNWCRHRKRWPNRFQCLCATWTNAADWRCIDKSGQPPHHPPLARANTPSGYPICSGQTMDQTNELDSDRASVMKREEHFRMNKFLSISSPQNISFNGCFWMPWENDETYFTSRQKSFSQLSYSSLKA